MDRLLVPSMSYKEMYDILMDDFPKVRYWAEKQLDKVKKELMMASIFPAFKIIKYQSPLSNNRYYIYFYVGNASLLNDPYVGHFAEFFIKKNRFLVAAHMGGYKPLMKDVIVDMPQVYAYSHHFFEQYNKRFLKDESLTINEIACHFFSRNRLYEPVRINERVNRNIDNYDENADRGFKVKDGFCFTVYDIDIEDIDANPTALFFLFTTYMNVDGLKEEQINAILEESHKSWDIVFLPYRK